MPTYNYRCTECNHELEVIQKMSEDPLTFCPACDEKTLKKIIKSVRFTLKGWNWPGKSMVKTMDDVLAPQRKRDAKRAPDEMKYRS